MKITEEKELKAVVKLFNDMNQLCKTRQEDTSYTIFKGKWYMFGDEETLIKDISEPILNKKNEFIQALLPELKTVINGKQLYDFIKDYKKNINSFMISNGMITFETDIPGIAYTSSPIDKDNKDLKEYKRIVTRYIKPATKVVVKKEISSDEVAAIKKMKTPYILEDNNIKFKMSKNILFNTKANVETLVAITDLDSSNNLYLVRIIQKQKDVKSDSFCIIINY